MSASAIIFLDIDGVLQPPNQQDRFCHDLEKLRINLTVRHDDDEYLELDRHDLGAVYYDWHKEAVERLRQLCIEFNAKIVISSDWRSYNPLSILKYYFRIHGLDRYIVGETVQSSKAPLYRAGEVRQYIDEHPEIERFVILDDRYDDNFQSIYPQNFVHTRDFLTEEDYQRAREILSNILAHHEVKEIEGWPSYGKIISQLATNRILGGVGQRDNQTYVFPLNTPRGINVLQAQAFGDPHHNGIFVTHNNVQSGKRQANFCCESGIWHNDEQDIQPIEERGIIHNTKEPEVEQLAQGIRLIYEMTWCDADDEPLFDEVRTIELYEGKDGTYCDLNSQHVASYDMVEFVNYQHGAIGVHVQYQLLPEMGARADRWDGDYRSHFHGYSRHNREMDGRYLFFEKEILDLGFFGVFLSVLQNTRSEEERLSGPWLVKGGIIQFYPHMGKSVTLEPGESWTIGLRTVAYDGRWSVERAMGWNSP